MAFFMDLSVCGVFLIFVLLGFVFWVFVFIWGFVSFLCSLVVFLSVFHGGRVPCSFLKFSSSAFCAVLWLSVSIQLMAVFSM